MTAQRPAQIRPGPRCGWPDKCTVYDNPSFPLPLPEPVTVTELVDVGDGPVQAILTGSSGALYEVSARNLRAAPEEAADAS